MTLPARETMATAGSLRVRNLGEPVVLPGNGAANQIADRLAIRST